MCKSGGYELEEQRARGAIVGSNNTHKLRPTTEERGSSAPRGRSKVTKSGLESADASIRANNCIVSRWSKRKRQRKSTLHRVSLRVSLKISDFSPRGTTAARHHVSVFLKGKIRRVTQLFAVFTAQRCHRTEGVPSFAPIFDKYRVIYKFSRQ